MTRDDAVNWLINISADIGKAEHRALWHYEQTLDEIKEMLEGEHEALEGKDTNVLSNDCISRQAAINAECEVCQIASKKDRGHNCIYYVHRCKEIECLRALPSAQPDRPHGRWYWDNALYDFICTACGRTADHDIVKGIFSPPFEYCPHCGAKMEPGKYPKPYEGGRGDE